MPAQPRGRRALPDGETPAPGSDAVPEDLLRAPAGEAAITVVDVNELAIYLSLGQDLTVYDEWLTEAGNDLAKELGDGQDQADVA
ncbi:hypothetical protein [Promicromonospora sp. AC04]|uniref:hypothetical protein n=1 Tax=Promicromonospora sp. AC04 TaxID=2135723 RepID=UPI0011B1FAD9|nr:hypothetical protein [Promicromonospora sp. AC04]